MFKKCSWYLIPSTSTQLSVYFNMALLSQEILAWENGANLCCFSFRSFAENPCIWTLDYSPCSLHYKEENPFLPIKQPQCTHQIVVFIIASLQNLHFSPSIQFSTIIPHFAKYHSRSLHWKIHQIRSKSLTVSFTLGFSFQRCCRTLPSVQHCDMS